jgi:hypothetical protein
MRKTNSPPFLLAKSQLKRVVRAAPICKFPDGLGAIRTLTFIIFIIPYDMLKIKALHVYS